MANHSLASVVHYLRHIALVGLSEGCDAELLDQFARQGDELAFEKMVAVHGPMVLGLCRRMLRHEQDAEDAFQATFLTLARKAGTIRNKEALASWLYKVAYRIARHMGSRTASLTNRMPLVLDVLASKSEVDLLWPDLRSVLDQEVAALSESCRRLLVLCYFEGKTNEEAGRLLGCPKGTVATRLARARNILCQRLTRRGLTLSTGLLATTLTEKAVAVSPSVRLVRSALVYASIKGAGAGSASVKVLALSEGVMRMFWFNKMKMVASVTLAVIVGGMCVGLVVRETWARGDATHALPERNDQLAKNGKTDQKAGLQADGKAEIGDLRKEIASLHGEIATLRTEIRSLKEALRHETVPQETELLFQGKQARFWLDQFKDADSTFRLNAVKALGSLAEKNRTLIPVLGFALKDKDDRVAEYATTIMGEFGPEAVPALLDVLREAPPIHVLDRAARAIVKIGPKAKATVPFLSQALNADDWGVRYNVICALHSIGPDAKSTLPAIVKVLGNVLELLQVETKNEETKLGAVPTMDFLSELGAALSKIDPDVQGTLQRILTLRPDQGGTQYVRQWRQVYDLLKQMYKKQP
jgi:RNA polymerase sigma factor (sigma-70 family)